MSFLDSLINKGLVIHYASHKEFTQLPPVVRGAVITDTYESLLAWEATNETTGAEMEGTLWFIDSTSEWVADDEI